MDKGYLVIELQKLKDGMLSQLCTAYTDRSVAEQKYHQILGFAAVSDVPIHTAVILSEEGNLIKKESYRHEVAE